MRDKASDLAGPGISTYDEVQKILPENYEALLPPLRRMEALYMIKEYIEKGLAEALNLQMVQVPLIVSQSSGVNDYLDRDGSRTPVEFPAGLGLDKRIDAQVVQAATKWKRMALAQFDCPPGPGYQYGYESDKERLFSGSRPLCLCRSVGLGKNDHA